MSGPIGLAVMSTWSSVARSASPNEQLRVALIGTGGRSQSLLGPLLERKDVAITAVCDPDQSRVGRMAEQLDKSTGKKPTTVAYQYADDKVLLYEDRGWTPYGLYGYDSGNAFYGTEGWMLFTRRGYFEVRLGRKEEPGPSFRGNTGGPQHVHNFLDCVRSRQEPNACAEVAHLTCGLVHLGEIAYRTSRILHFDPATETFATDADADALLTKEYRKPWGPSGRL